MNHHAKKSNFNRKPWLKILIITIIVITVICGLLWVNAFWGNPIRKQIAKTFCLDYFEEMYQEEFIIYEISYWNKLPGYVLTLCPKNDPQIQFTCNPNCDTLCYSDEYGGVLASRLLVEQIRQILDPAYGGFAIQINASEDPFTWYEGETPAYFERNPHIRLTKNHQELSISWVDPLIQTADFDQIVEDMSDLIKTQLPMVNPNLQVHIAVFPDASKQEARFEAHDVLFDNHDPEH